MNIYKRLDQIEEKIKKSEFLENKGMGNEVGYFVFDYDCGDELIVRNHIKNLVNKINNGHYNFKIIEFDLYEIIIEILEEKGYLEKVFEYEKTKGLDFTKNAIIKLLKLSSESNLIVKYIQNNVEDNSVVFLTGVGKAYPLLRSHHVLNNLHQKLDKIPVVLFFPGFYSGNNLVLFKNIEDGNYYRAFKLVERV